MAREEILKIEHVSKRYKLGMIGGTTLRDELQRKRALRKGLEDPTKRVTDTSTGRVGEEFLALNDVTFSVYQGERVGIIGHNGAGKSTLLKLISRITAPSEGTIEMNGRVASMLEVGTGFHPELTGRENIYMNGAILGMSKNEIDSKIEDIIEFSECRKFIDTPVKRYSSGMYVKLAFSVAAHLDSEIMIMDEVLAVGDMEFQKKCLDKMSDVSHKEGRTILYVSHNMNTIRQLCDRCIVLNHGRIAFDGDVDKAAERYLNMNIESAPSVDLTSMKRTQNLIDGIELTKIAVKNRDLWKICVGEKLEYVVTAKSNRDISGVYYRNRIFATDGTSVSVMLAPNPINCRAGDVIELTIEADISQLVPGRYCITPSLYGVNRYGGWQFYDHIDKAVTFEIDTALDFNNNMEWEPHWWGYVKLPELIMKEEIIKER